MNKTQIILASAIFITVAVVLFSFPRLSSFPPQTIKQKTIPPDGKLISFSPAENSGYSLRWTWELTTSLSQQQYIQWLKDSLGEEYRVNEEGTRTIFLREDPEDYFRIEFSHGEIFPPNVKVVLTVGVQ